MYKEVDKLFFWLSLILVFSGFFIFFSASLGLLAKNTAQFSGVLFNQTVSLLLGIGAAAIIIRLPVKFLKHFALPFFLFTIAVTALVFVPEIGVAHAGAKRWLSAGPFTIQPAEFLKIGFVIYFAAWLSAMRKHVTSFMLGLLPLLAMMAIVGGLLLLQPDTGTFAVIFITGAGMFLASGARWKDISILLGGGLVGLFALMLWKPYIKERIFTFLNPAIDPQGASYQIQQSLIAIGSGELWGRGFGQSVQKFGFLPEPIGDSVFAVFAEEFGFLGGVALIALFALFAFRGFVIAARAPNQFSRLTVIGIVILLVGQAFLNIGAMLGVVPLTGMPLPFVSHGGSALLATLIGVGIILGISRYMKT